jgi:hypothetical protein
MLNGCREFLFLHATHVLQVSLEGARAPSQEITEYHKDQPLPIQPFVFFPMPMMG